MEEERYLHIKHTLKFPVNSIKYCLEQAGGVQKINAIAVATDPEQTNQNKKHFISQNPDIASSVQFSDSLSIENSLQDELCKIDKNLAAVPIFWVSHHKAHAASTFYVSPYDTAAILTIDGMGNWVTTTAGIGQGNTIKKIWEIPHPHSLGLFYGSMTQFLGFHASCDECKVMGLASYGKPTHLDALLDICTYQNGEIRLDLEYFTFHKSPLMNSSGGFNTWYSPKMESMFGSARTPEGPLTERDMDIAHSVQALLELRTYEILRDLHKKTGTDNLCMAGGVALNSSLNGKIIHNTPFKNVFILPAANDAGLSLGAALAVTAQQDRHFRKTSLEHAYFGSCYDENEIASEIEKINEDLIISKPDDLIAETAKLLNEFHIIGWYQDRMEFGPRALGNRSILANPTIAETKDIVNQKVKFREDFRPFAPVIPLEYVSDFFNISEESPFMLKVVEVKSEKRNIIPAVTHVDNTARVQTLKRTQNEKLYDLLMKMKSLNGVPVLLNTSFNVRGDTIVRTPKDAIDCLLKTGLSALVIGPYLLIKKVKP